MQEDLTMATCNIQALLDLTKGEQGFGSVIAQSILEDI